MTDDVTTNVILVQFIYYYILIKIIFLSFIIFIIYFISHQVTMWRNYM